MSRSVRQLLARLERLEVLYRISNIVNTTLETNEVLRLLLEEVVRITNATSGSIAMVDYRRGILDIEAAVNIHPRLWKSLKLQIGVGVTGYSAYIGKPVRVDDVEKDPHYVRLKADIRSEMALPMIINGKVIGVINVDSTRRGAFTQDDEDLCMAVAIQSAKVIETARLYSAVKRHAEEMDALFTLGKTLIMPGPLEQILERLVAEGLSMFNGKVCALLEAMEDESLRPWSISGGMTPDAERLHAQLAAGLLTPVAKAGKPLRIDDLSEGQRSKSKELAEREGLMSLAAVPVGYQGRVLAVLVLYTAEPRRFREPEIRLLQLLANQGALAIENARRMDRLTVLEESLRQSERFSLLGTLAAEIAHEIRNPITIINLLMHSIQESPGHSDQTKTDLSTIMKKLDRINQIIEQTLSLSKTSESNLTAGSLNKIVEDILLFMNYKFTKAGIRVHPALDPKVPDFPMDSGQLQQVLLNLFLNAMQAMPQGGELHIRTKLASDRKIGPCVRLVVEDTGTGIDEGSLEQLFDPFYTTREGGTGLGLFISNKLIKRHNGSIKVRSTPGQGSAFTVTLPIAAQEPES